ncbi:hypothetical protein AWJ20_4193 [Sugiyamaella lignohabitans]|uniref:G-patch domain-containing protein n=1 Tax=Sugiyamaella lignohabitans TaxID=796027 RepID=A0A167C992_9ASCO|nr:uncharacterized protein AWJ20_4193 [Sugiyamaella lignohabitans]ANB11384.1 hypothetical protein AWJ20_4193 [Sugiyamaella lignohabitans]
MNKHPGRPVASGNVFGSDSEEDASENVSKKHFNRLAEIGPVISSSEPEVREDDEDDDVDEEEDYMSMVLPGHEPEKDFDEINREELLSKAQGLTKEDISLRTNLKRSLIEREPENKGLKMMKLMGFKPGSSLGAASTESQLNKDQARSNEPIVIEIKKGRGGIGYDSALRDEVNKSVDVAIEKQKESKENFLSRISESYSDKKLSSQIKSAQKVALDLDATADGVEPETIYEAEDPFSVNIIYRSLVCEHQLNKKVRELRRNMENPSFDTNISVELLDMKGDDKSQKELEEFQLLEKSHQLFRVLIYLRSVYFYCMWCGFSYNDENDLEENCPGMLEQDH